MNARMIYRRVRLDHILGCIGNEIGIIGLAWELMHNHPELKSQLEKIINQAQEANAMLRRYDPLVEWEKEHQLFAATSTKKEQPLWEATASEVFDEKQKIYQRHYTTERKECATNV